MLGLTFSSIKGVIMAIKKWRELTLAEISLAKKVFGESIDYTSVKIYDRKYMPLQPNYSGMTPNGKIYVAGVYRSDYGSALPDLQGFFIHEMAHVYQHQLKILKPILAAIGETLKHGFNYSKAYQYTLSTKKDLLDYDIEQQAQIVEDYFRIYHLHLSPIPGFLQNTLIDAKSHRLFHKVLGSFLANPNYARHKTTCKRVGSRKHSRVTCKRVLIK